MARTRLSSSRPVERRRGLARELASLPVGLVVAHQPAQVYARVAFDSPLGPYIWTFSVTVQVAGTRPLRVEKYGIAAWRKDHWVYGASRQATVGGGARLPHPNIFRVGEFERDFECPSGWLEPGTTYTLDHAWAGSRRLKAHRQLWYVVGRDEEGQRFTGQCTVELQGWMVN